MPFSVKRFLKRKDGEIGVGRPVLLPPIVHVNSQKQFKEIS
jgi:hypothetical protein